MTLDLRSAHVRDWMTVSVPVITPKTTIATALRLLREHGVPALPLYTEGGAVALVDEKSLLRFTPSEATTLDVYELREVLDRMTVARAAVRPRVTVTPDVGLDAVAAQMLGAGAEVIPVMEEGRFVGLLTWASLLAAVVEEASRTTSHAEAAAAI